MPHPFRAILSSFLADLSGDRRPPISNAASSNIAKAPMPGFTAKYGCKQLVWYEEHLSIGTAKPAREVPQAMASAVEDRIDRGDESGLTGFVLGALVGVGMDPRVKPEDDHLGRIAPIANILPPELSGFLRRIPLSVILGLDPRIHSQGALTPARQTRPAPASVRPCRSRSSVCCPRCRRCCRCRT